MQIKIKQVSNGHVIESWSGHEEDQKEISVIEDKNTEHETALSIARTVWHDLGYNGTKHDEYRPTVGCLVQHDVEYSEIEKHADVKWLYENGYEIIKERF
jgi:peroxiredoxin